MIYFDYQASTPIAPEVAAIMQPFLEGQYFANPHSVDHAFGNEAAQIVEKARQEVALAVGARTAEIVFTSGATEANNTAILGTMFSDRSRPAHLVISAIEHACVFAPAKYMQAEGGDLSIIGVDASGVVDLKVFEQSLRPETKLVSIMLVNNEIGTIQPIAEIAELCKSRDILLHCDASQALGRLAIRVKDLGVDMLSLSAHKAYGPKGIGALYIRRGVKLKPILHGGGQERLVRSGTLSPMLCAGFGEAAKLADERHAHDQQRGGELIEKLFVNLQKAEVPFSINGDPKRRIRDAASLHFPEIEVRTLLASMPDIGVSTASACSGTKGEGSHVLHAIGIDPRQKSANIRLSVGRPTTESDIKVLSRRLSGEKFLARP